MNDQSPTRKRYVRKCYGVHGAGVRYCYEPSPWCEGPLHANEFELTEAEVAERVAEYEATGIMR